MAGNGNLVISEADGLIKIPSVPDYWASFTGGGKSVTTADAWNGGAKAPSVIAGKPVLANIVLKRPFLPARDLEQARTFQAQVSSRVDSISVQYTDANGQAVGKPIVWQGCLLVGNDYPPVDASSNNPGYWTVTYKPQSSS